VIPFEFLRPGMGLLVVLSCLVLLAGLRAAALRRQTLRSLGGQARSAHFLPGLSATRPHLRLGLAVLALALLAFAASGPVRGFTMRTSSRRGIDLVVCIDTSRSMLARDLRPSRLERALREVRGLLDGIHGDRLALVAFSGDTREVSPLTHDRHTLAALLDFVRPEDNRRGGTDLAAAIKHGLTLFDGRTGASEAIVLLTDGEDLEGRAAEVAETAAERGIRVFVVGIGTEGGGKIPVTLRDGSQGFLRGPDGQEVISKLDGTSLEHLADLTGGAYLSVENSPTPLLDLFKARISKLEGRDLQEGQRRVPFDRFQWPLALALACMFVEMGIRDRNARTSTPRESNHV